MNTFASMRPASGQTARVWEIADEITRETGSLARRRDVIARSVAEGGNANTASTQYHFWKSAHAEAGRDASPSADARPGTVGSQRLTLGSDGRLVIPVEMRRAMLIGDAGIVMAEVRKGELAIISPATALQRARDLVRAFDQGGGSPVDELLAERRREAGEE